LIPHDWKQEECELFMPDARFKQVISLYKLGSPHGSVPMPFFDRFDGLLDAQYRHNNH
jgi:hypothetical protein